MTFGILHHAANSRWAAAHVQPNNYFTMNNPDKSTLSVVDQYKKEVLNIHYVNPHVIKFSALLHDPNVPSPIEINDEALTMGDNVVAGNCEAALGNTPVISFYNTKQQGLINFKPMAQPTN